jgi:hypothetical protein
VGVSLCSVNLHPSLNNVQDSPLGLFSLFQVTIGEEHDVDEKGLNYMLLIAKNAKLKAIAIRYIGIVPSGVERTFKAPISWRGKLNTRFLLP